MTTNEPEVEFLKSTFPGDQWRLDEALRTVSIRGGKRRSSNATRDRVVDELAGIIDQRVVDLRDRLDIVQSERERLEDDQAVLVEAKRRIEAGDEDLTVAVSIDLDMELRDRVDVYRRYMAENPDPTAGPTMRGKRLVSGDESLSTGYRGKAPLPGELPELRALLSNAWGEGQLFRDIASLMVMDKRIDDAESYSAWERRTFERATLWWVSEQMVDVLLAAAATVPSDVRGDELVPLSDYGFVVLEKPWTGESVDADLHPELRDGIAIDAFSWGPVTLPDLPTRPSCPGVCLSSYQWAPYSLQQQANHGRSGDPALLDMMRQATMNARTWFPLGRSDWPLVDELGEPPWPMSDQQLKSFAEDRRVLCALMTVLAHDGLATTHAQTVPRGTRRRLERAGERADGKYRVVTLRTLRDADAGGVEGGDGEKRTHDHRWIVEGHWRRQPYGPGRTLRRLQYINPYVKGPEDRPLKVRETIHAWRR